jgi:hypothetical protein
MWDHLVKNLDRDAECVSAVKCEFKCVFMLNMPLKVPRRFSGDRDIPRQIVARLSLSYLWFDHCAWD